MKQVYPRKLDRKFSIDSVSNLSVNDVTPTFNVIPNFLYIISTTLIFILSIYFGLRNNSILTEVGKFSEFPRLYSSSIFLSTGVSLPLVIDFLLDPFLADFGDAITRRNTLRRMFLLLGYLVPNVLMIGFITQDTRNMSIFWYLTQYQMMTTATVAIDIISILKGNDRFWTNNTYIFAEIVTLVSLAVQILDGNIINFGSSLGMAFIALAVLVLILVIRNISTSADVFHLCEKFPSNMIKFVRYSILFIFSITIFIVFITCVLYHPLCLRVTVEYLITQSYIISTCVCLLAFYLKRKESVGNTRRQVSINKISSMYLFKNLDNYYKQSLRLKLSYEECSCDTSLMRSVPRLMLRT